MWLRRDGDFYRMASDVWDYCTIRVDSGSHPRYKADPAKPLNHALVDILLTRGEGEVDDDMFAREISQWELALTESHRAREGACSQLWVIQQDTLPAALRKEARSALDVAHCKCADEGGHLTRK